MKKAIIPILFILFFFAATVTAGTVIGMRGDGTVVFIDDQKEEIVARVVTGEYGGAMGAITPDGKKLYVANNSKGYYTVSVIDINNRKLIKNLPTGPRPSHAYVSSNGKYVGVAHKNSENGNIVIAVIDAYGDYVKHRILIDLENDAYRGVVNAHQGWLGDGKHLLIPNWADNVTHVIDADEGKEVARLQHKGNPHQYSTTKDKKELWVSVDAIEDDTGNKVGCGQIDIYDISAAGSPPSETAKQTLCIKVNDGESPKGHHTALTRDGKFAYAANDGLGKGNSVDVFDVNTKERIAHLTTGGMGPAHPFMSPDGKYVVMGQIGGTTVTFIDAKKHEIVKELTIGSGKGVQWIAFTKDNKKAFINNQSEDAIYVIDLKKMKVGKKIVTGEKDKMWKSQYHVSNGWYQTYEVVEPILD